MVVSLLDLWLSEYLLLPIVEGEESAAVGDAEADEDALSDDQIDWVLSGIIMFSTKLVLITLGSISITLIQ